MDLMDDPDLKKKYDKCKYIVKLWEHTFTKSQKRLPSKLDIREAPSDVRHAYRKYYQLKTAVLEHSFMDVEGFEIEEASAETVEYNTQGYPAENNEYFSNQNKVVAIPKEDPDNSVSFADDVWGSHLNNKKSPEVPDGNKTQIKSTVKSAISKKLFCGSKFNKRNPRKSLSFSQKNKSNSDLDAPIFLSQPTSLSTGKFISEEAIASSPKSHAIPFVVSEQFNIVMPREKLLTQPVNIKSVFQNGCNQSLRTVDTGWLNRVIQDTEGSLDIPSKLDSDSDEIIYDSEDEERPLRQRMSSLHIAKRKKIEQTYFRNDRNRNTGSESGSGLEASEKPNIFIDALNTRNLSRETEGYYCETNESQVLSAVTQSGNPVIADSFKSTYKDVTDNKTSKIQTDAHIPEVITTLKQINKNQVVKDVYTFEGQLDAVVKKKCFKKTSSKQRVKKSAKTRLRKPSKVANLQSLNSDKTETEESEVILPVRRSSRATKVKVSLEELSSGEEDPFHSDNDDKDPEFSLTEHEDKKFEVMSNYENIGVVVESNEIVKKRKGRNSTKEIKNNEIVKKRKGRNSTKEIPNKEKITRKKSQNRKHLSKKEDENEDLNKEESVYELEFCVKPRVVAPRYTNVKKVLKECKKNVTTTQKDDSSQNPPKDKRQVAREKLEQKIASGNLNDNFVTIDIKKKIFSRHRTGNKFAKFKKSQWRANKKKNALCGPEMNMGGCDGGPLICFTCGQVGHFAQHCKSTKGDGLLPLSATQDEEEECPYLTLEEASQMAKESVLSIRMPRSNQENSMEKDKNEQQEANDSDGDDQDEIDWGNDFNDGDLLKETLRLEEHIKKLDIQAYMDNVKVVEPYFKLNNDDGSMIETPREVWEALQKFGHNTFREGQEKAVMRILSGKSTLVTLSTGSGKSLCYQLPAYLYSRREPCISLIISPLVSLMEDQVTGIPKFLKAACLHTNQSKTQRQKILESLSDGELSVLLISPEAVVAGEKQTGFGSVLRKLPPIAFACIDEAHCVSQWSHNFRPSYLMICRVLRESLGVKTILGLTATATRATCDSIIEHIGITDGHEGIITDMPLPDNLVLTVSKDTNRDMALMNLLLSERFLNCQSIIVYCTRRDECERIASILRTCLKSERIEESTNKKRKRLNLQAEPYHAGLPASRRKSIQNSFMSGALRIVVATVAFGMGINKSDIRAVIHFNMPSSFESYVQEVGRAGRDGLAAHCHAFLDSQGRDENELRRHIYANSLDRHVIRKLLQKIFLPCSCKAVCPKHEVAFSIEQTVRALDLPEENISTLLCYLELHENTYIKLLSPAYTVCKVISYGGPLQIRKAARDCPPLAMALALHKTKPGEDPNVFEFPVVDVAASMGWDSGICKHKLKNLEWTSVNNQPKRSLISIAFSNLGFRLLAPGNLTDDQLDEALDSLHGRVQSQEQTALKQLKAIHETLTKVAEKSFKDCIKLDDTTQKNTLKLKVREYFESKNPLDDFNEPEANIDSEEQLVNDIRALICMYSNNQFTGRAIARIFQGIQSPNYPAVEWGRCKFWRSHLGDDFHEISRIATREIIHMR